MSYALALTTAPSDTKADRDIRSPRSERMWLVDFVRQLSIALVLSCHLFQSHLPTFPAIDRWNFWLVLDGDIGVWMFFLISGFVIARSTAKQDGSILRIRMYRFYVARVARLLPLLIVAVALGIFFTKAPFLKSNALYHLVFGYSKGAFFWITFFTCTFNWLRVITGQWYGMHWDIYWSLAIEEQFYALFPWSLKLDFVRKNISSALVALIMIAPVGRFVCTRLFPLEFVAMNSFCALDLMALGVLLHLLILKYGDAAKQRLAMCHLFCLLGGFCVLYIVTSDRPGAFGIYGPSVLGLGLLVFLFFGLQIRWIQQLPRFLAMGGELSYGAYLLHPLALLALFPVLINRAFIIDYPLYFFSVMALAWCSFRFVERPLNSQIKRWLLQNEK